MTDLASQTSGSAVARAFAVFELLAREVEPGRLSAVAQRLGVQKSTVHRVLLVTCAAVTEQVGHR